MSAKVINSALFLIAVSAWAVHMAAPDVVGISAMVMIVLSACGFVVNATLALARFVARSNALSHTVWSMAFLVVCSMALVSIQQMPALPIETPEYSEMLAAYRKSGDVTARNENEDTLLKLAVECHQYELIRELASHSGMTPEIRNEAAMSAVRHGSKKELEILFESGVTCNACVDSISLLMQAAMYGNEKMVKYLLAAGADITVQDDRGRTAMHHGVLSEHLQVVQLLREAQKKCAAEKQVSISEIDVEDYSGCRPVEYASFSEMMDVFND